MIKKICIWLSVLLFAIGIAASILFNVNTPRLNATEKQLDVFPIVLSAGEQLPEEYMYENIGSIEDMIEESSNIVHVTATDDINIDRTNVYRRVVVNSSYKGNARGDIYVYEPCHINLHRDAVNNYTLTYGYNLMQPGEEYILFLRDIGQPERDFHYAKTKQNAFLIANGAFGKYMVGNVGKTELLDVEKCTAAMDTLYGEIRDYEYLAYLPEVLSQYIEWKTTVLQLYKTQ